MIEAIEQTLDQPPVYVLRDGTTHRRLNECYENATIHTLRPMLILTFEEYQILVNTSQLKELINELS